MDELVFFNGVDAETGGYLFPAEPLASVAAGVQQDQPGGRHVGELRRRHAADEAHLGVMYGADPEDLASAGWAVVTTADTDPGVLEALEPLRTLRRGQAGERYRELVRLPGEDDDAFLTRHGAGPGPVDPRRVPYYVLLVGDPETLPFSFQYQLDVEYAVGRLHFDTLAEYAAYADTVAAAERAPAGAARRRVHLFAPRNPGDSATALSASRLVAPLAAELAEHSEHGEFGDQLAVTQDIGELATRARLAELLAPAGAPDLLFTASHGLGSAGAAQREVQGALVCQDWRGPLLAGATIDESQYLAGGHLPSGTAVGPRVVYSFSCYGAGTPRESDFGTGSAIAERAFLARLPQRLLGRPGGALAFVGHVDRAFSCSFLWNGVDPQITGVASALRAAADGLRLGHAMEYVNSRYADIATTLTARLQELHRFGRTIDGRTLVALWTANHDARNYVVIGDPAVRAWHG